MIYTYIYIYGSVRFNRQIHGSCGKKSNNKPAGAFVGYDLTLAVNSRPWRGEDELPGFIAAANLTPAGSHHARAAIGLIEKLHATGQSITDVTADRAYNNAKTEFWTNVQKYKE